MEEAFKCVSCGSIIEGTGKIDNKDHLIIRVPSMTKSGSSELYVTFKDKEVHCENCIDSILRYYVETLT